MSRGYSIALALSTSGVAAGVNAEEEGKR